MFPAFVCFGRTEEWPHGYVTTRGGYTRLHYRFNVVLRGGYAREDLATERTGQPGFIRPRLMVSHHGHPHLPARSGRNASWMILGGGTTRTADGICDVCLAVLPHHDWTWKRWTSPTWRVARQRQGRPWTEEWCHTVEARDRDG